MLWREKPAVEQIAEVIEAERREPGGWERFEGNCNTVGTLIAGASHPHQHDIARRMKRDCGYGSIQVVMAVVNIILAVLRLLEWWQERRQK